jgi:hypothetical protein
MTEIDIQVAGDHWVNQDYVVQKIQQCRGQDYLVFKVNHEGPSLHALGIVDAISTNIADIGISPNQVGIDCWHNTVETIPFDRLYTPNLSHFFWYSNDYRFSPRSLFQDHYPMAFFVGRLTFERSIMLWDISRRWSTNFLFSLMRQSSPINFSWKHVDKPWIEPYQAEEFMRWIHSSPFPSITGHQVRDQYAVGNNTNRDLVAHYNRFAVELVAETYCKGETFFPTEKTVRPISQGKPFLVYGPKHFLARLRQLGFHTWGEIWDESYDDLEGHDRWIAMQQTLGQIINNDLWKHNLIASKSKINQAVLEYLIEKHGAQ